MTYVMNRHEPEFRETQEMLLPIGVSEARKEPGKVFFQTCPQFPFKPVGLLLWNVHSLDEVAMCLVGRDFQLVASFAPIPAAWFATGYSYEEVEKRAEQGKYPAAWGRWDASMPGMNITLEVTVKDPRTNPQDIRALFWGHGIR